MRQCEGYTRQLRVEQLVRCERTAEAGARFCYVCGKVDAGLITDMGWSRGPGVAQVRAHDSLEVLMTEWE